jgi:hypothetical protein
MSDSKRILILVGLFLVQGSIPMDAQITTQPFQYNGGTFTVTTAFQFFTSIETDSIVGTTHLQPLVTITNIKTGRSMTTSYVSENDFMSGPEGNMLTGNEVIPGRLNPRTNIGVVSVDASGLGPGPLVLSVKQVSELSGRASQKIRNVFDGAFYVWTISPQSIRPSLSPYVPRPSPTPVSNPPPSPAVSANIHAVIISGRSDPAKIVTSQNVTLTGGVVALGKDPAPPAAPSSWTTGLRIVPDEALLTGAKIPPLTPNIIDIRIVKHEVIGDLAAPGASPSP